MHTLSTVLALSVVAHSGSSTVTPEMRALHALEHAAQAAQQAAEAAARAAAAAEKAAGGPAAEPAAAAPAADAGKWTASVGAGLIWLSGNSKTLTFNVNAAAERKTDAWILSAKATGAYGRTTLPNTEEQQTTALGGAIGLRVDRRYTPKITAYIAPLVETDRVKDIDYRVSIEAGSGITWLDEMEGELQKSSLRTDLGVRIAQEHRAVFFPEEINPDPYENNQPPFIVAPRLGVAFKYALSKDVIFTEDAEVLPSLLEETGTRVFLNSNSKLSVHLTSVLSFGTSLLIAHDTQPAAGREKTDTALNVGLEVQL